MKMPLVHDIKNPKCKLLDVIFIDIDCRETRQELSRNGIKPVNKALNAIKIRLIAMFYGIDIKYVVDELNNSKELNGIPFQINFKLFRAVRGFFTF